MKYCQSMPRIAKKAYIFDSMETKSRSRSIIHIEVCNSSTKTKFQKAPYPKSSSYCAFGRILNESCITKYWKASQSRADHEQRVNHTYNNGFIIIF